MSSGAGNAPQWGQPSIPIAPSNGLELVQIATEQVEVANDWLETLSELSGEILPIAIDPDFPNLPSPPTLGQLTLPEFDDVVYDAPTIPAPFNETIDIEDYMPEPFDEDPPALIFGEAPDSFTDVAPDAPSVNTVFDDPGDLNVTLPAPPELLTLTISTFAGVTIPSFTEAAPTMDMIAPSVLSYDQSAAYTSTMLTALQATLLDRFTNGGTGLSADVEQGIWDRSREREIKAKQEAIAGLERMEVMGYAYPPGVYLDARIKIETEMAAVSVGHSREVMIKQAELEQNNVLKAIDSAIELEKVLINADNERERLLFESTKYATEAAVAIYNGRVQAFAAYIDAYRAKINAYDAQIKGEIAKVDAYRAQVAAESAKAEVNTALVQQYKVQADVALSAIDVYKAQVDAIRAKAEIEKLKVDIYGEQIRAFTARVNAYTAEVEGFRAVTAAEATKQDAFKSQVQAYSAQVDAGAKAIQLRIDEYKARIDAKMAEYDGYKAAVQGEVAKTQAIANKNSTVSDAFRAEVSAVTSYNDSLTKQFEATIEQIQRTTEISVSVAKANAELAVSSRSIALEAAKVGGQVSAQIAASALNAFNWSINQSFGWSNSSSWNESLADSYSESESNSTAEITNLSA